MKVTGTMAMDRNELDGITEKQPVTDIQIIGASGGANITAGHRNTTTYCGGCTITFSEIATRLLTYLDRACYNFCIAIYHSDCIRTEFVDIESVAYTVDIQ